MRILHLKQDGQGQWMYSIMMGTTVHVAWQYGSYSKDETIVQCRSRFSFDNIA
jgi:hypothetical protein